MIISLAYVAAYVLLLGAASAAEKPVGQTLGAFQLNVVIRGGGLVVGIGAVLAVHGLALPAPLPLLAGLGIGVIAGTGSICYCLALDWFPVSVVTTGANLYLVVTVLLGVVILHEAVTTLKIISLALTLAGVLALSYSPGRFGVQSGQGTSKTGRKFWPFAILAAYVVLIGTSTFLEKPALRVLDATQLNALQAIGMVAVATAALALRGRPLPPPDHVLTGSLLGAMIGLGSVFYFLGLRHLPVSVAAAISNAYVVVTILLSVLFLHQRLNWRKWSGIALTVVGVTLLAYSAG